MGCGLGWCRGRETVVGFLCVCVCMDGLLEGGWGSEVFDLRVYDVGVCFTR